MTGFIILALAGAVLWLIVRRNEAVDRLDRLDSRLHVLELTLAQLKRPHPESTERTAQVPSAAQAPAQSFSQPVNRVTPPPIPPILPKPEPVAPLVQPAFVPGPALVSEAVPAVAIPPLLRSQTPEEHRSEPAINLENFLGVKLFAWLGGFLLFLAVAFFIKHAFERNLITPLMRVTFGYIAGIGLVVGGLFIPRERHAVTVQTLCATGLVVLYANIFASHALFHFIGPAVAFSLMAVVTATAFGLALKLNAQVVAVLGLLGGFLTPILLPARTDNALGLFGYLALLDLGLLAIALRQRWNHLSVLAGVATVGMQFLWVQEFFVPAKYGVANTIFLGFAALFVAAFGVANYYKRVEQFLSAAVIVVLSGALIFPLYILWHPWRELAQNAIPLFTFIFLIDAGFLALAWWRNDLRLVSLASGGAVFFLLSSWTAQYLTPATLNIAFALYILFAVLHSVIPVVAQRRHGTGQLPRWCHLFPVLALVLVLFPIFKETELSWMLWPVVFAVDGLAIVLAVITMSVTPILFVFLLTGLVAASWIMDIPASTAELPQMLIVIVAFAVFFMAASLLAGRKVFAPASATSTPRDSDTFANVGALSATLPFMLLALVSVRLQLADPTPLFAVAALLAVLMLGMVRVFKVDAFAPAALLSVLVVEHVWHAPQFSLANGTFALAWYSGFALLFLAFPFVFQRHLQQRTLPWIVAALSLPLHFLLIYRSTLHLIPDFTYKGLIPAVLALPCLAGLVRLVLTLPKDLPTRNTLFALFGGVSLFFITFIFPIQYERHWLTIGWALEGAALVWLFRRVPHPGLRLIGVALLVTSFVRLSLNPWVITEYGRTGTPVWNWYLYTYGLVALALMTAARLLHPPRNRMGDFNVPPLLYALGTVLLFLLLNIEIADYFSGPGNRLVFNFSASFEQDMAYSLAWALFAFALLAVGFKLNNPPTRYAGMGLMIFTLAKLFLHDLWRLGGMYRIGSLIGLAVVLIVVSFIYQRFLSQPRTQSASAQ
jgi:uncharacterized membrane protein